jgi:hypothetical protein
MCFYHKGGKTNCGIVSGLERVVDATGSFIIPLRTVKIGGRKYKCTAGVKPVSLNTILLVTTYPVTSPPKYSNRPPGAEIKTTQWNA